MSNIKNIIAQSALQKALSTNVQKIGTHLVYSIEKAWQLEELVSNNLATEAQTIDEFEALLQTDDDKAVIISSFLINDILLKKILQQINTNKIVLTHILG